MRMLLALIVLLAGCTDTAPLAVDDGQVHDTDPLLPGVSLDVTIESSDRLWVNATVRNDGDQMYTLTGTPPSGCAPSFRFILMQGQTTVEGFPAEVCELYGERALGPGVQESMTFQWDMRPGDYAIEVSIDVLQGAPWGEHPDRATLVARHEFAVA